jgi:hypothetical protein
MGPGVADPENSQEVLLKKLKRGIILTVFYWFYGSQAG